jgi:hypothetical protein
LVGGSKCSKMLVQVGGVDERWQEERKKITKNVQEELYLGQEWREQRVESSIFVVRLLLAG